MSPLRWLESLRSAGALLLVGATLLLAVPACNTKPAGSSPSLPGKQGQPVALKPDAELLVGKWVAASGPGSRVEFTADGRVLSSSQSRVREARYRWARGRTVEFLAANGEMFARWQVDALGADQLVVTMNANQETFRRVR